MNRFPDFNTWHEVPLDATIPARTPFFAGYRGMVYEFHPMGLDGPISPFVRAESREYYTEKPILSPEEEKVEERARTMYYMVGGIGWEYEGPAVRDNWLNLARKYVEKED